MENLKENKMGVLPIPKVMLSMGLPMIVSMMVQAFYNIVDSYFVSRISDTAEISDMGDKAKDIKDKIEDMGDEMKK